MAAARSIITIRRDAARRHRRCRRDERGAHPIFRTHDETGRKAIYVNRLMTRRIEGLPEAESDALLEALFDHSEKPEFVYRHVWKVGDLLLWDNRCSTHARDDFPSDQRRLMLRTTVQGTVRPY
jgi:taurine dioxygenase